ncbi:hypothetical protein Poli38472_000582 [Pythium oligandrum]|uniref:WW domain-containing protein n=1 Tax=Pythium oligandrum TaxID=41045 RepID=A0A8K1FEH1_PYTOL|nr:hypothetical protein Poli38472_000582 [Pythium oligandrum]|eukprot:TMW60540.1 hypothetical protein Poli38472_000582 [Pythium oligandrum]
MTATEWEKYVDDSTQTPYYYNTKTGESSWDVPEGYVEPEVEEERASDAEERPEKPPRWRKYVDDSTGDAYYYDEANERTQWDEPEGFVEEDADEDDNDDNEEDGDASDPVAAVEEDAEAKDESDASADKPQTAAPETETPSEQHTWVKHIDRASGKPYYHDTVSGKTQWETPEHFTEANAAPAVSAEYLEYLNRSRAEQLARATQQALDPHGHLSRLNAVLSKIDPGSARPEDVGDEPEAADVADRARAEWQQHVDPSSQRYYYHNIVTGVTQWEKPDGPIASALGGDDYWASVGAAPDREGRQMSAFFDMSKFEENREQAKRIKEELKRKNIDWKKVAAEKKAKKKKRNSEWLFQD